MLDSIKNIGSTVNAILSSRQNIEKTLKDKCLNSYLSYLQYPHITRYIKKNFSYLSYIKKEQEEFYGNIPLILSDIEKELIYCKENPSFITINYYEIYLNKIKYAIEDERSKSKERFNCKINKFNDNLTIEKKYPLHIKDNEMHISLPFTVDGNGMARNVQATIFLENNHNDIKINDAKFSLGNIKPGSFVIPIDICIITPITALSINVLIEWNKTGNNEKYEDIFQFKLLGQDENIDWEKLKKIYPYSLEIVRGDQFIGRKDAVRRIWTRLSSPTVTSSYITGQKRVGKTSLAYAVMENKVLNPEKYIFIYKEYGDYENDSARKTLNDLGQQLVDELLLELPASQHALYNQTEFDGSLSPLIKLVTLLNKVLPDKKFIIVLDEFDEMHHELYRMGSLAETFFSNLRALSGRQNIGFILVGSEGMPHIMGAQGDKLNKFSRESLDSFDKVDEWKDYQDLIRLPVKDIIYWHNDSIYTIYEETSGHPFFTKTICALLVDQAIKLKDGEITSQEVKHFLPKIVSQLDVNVFAHFWKDGIDGDYKEKEIQSLNRCRILVAYARAKRKNEKTDLKTIASYVSSQKLSEDQVGIILNNFCFRRIMVEDNNEFIVRIKLFERWLISEGINIIIIDQLGDELSDQKRRQEDDAYIHPDEIVNLANRWPLYQGSKITTDIIRSWLQQIESQISQRLLFTLLKNIRFPEEAETNSMLIDAHDSLKSYFQGAKHITRKRSDRRQDIIVTYIDGAGKSGAYYAPKYCRENLLSTKSNTEIEAINKKLRQSIDKSIPLSGIVIIDDFIGTGNSISSNMKLFIDKNINELRLLNVPIKVIAIFSTMEGEDNVRSSFSKLNYHDIDLHICETLDEKHYAFTDNSNIWKSDDDKIQAKQICQSYGSKLSKRAPLGFKNQGLLLVFPRNCPNNSLAILHSKKSKAGFTWNPLFERAISC